MTHKVQIKITPDSNGSQVIVDGVELRTVKRITVEASVDMFSQVVLYLDACEIEIEGESHLLSVTDE